jgi:hypothetical protein
MCARFAARRQAAHLRTSGVMLGRRALLARGGDRRYLRSFSACSLRLAAQDVALSRRKQGFESPRERHPMMSPLWFQELGGVFV